MDPVRQRCTRSLHTEVVRPVRDILADMVAEAGPDEYADTYGGGKLITAFEEEVAALLGKPAAVFFPSGTMAQPLALRLWASRRGRSSVAMHPTSHLLLHEHGAYQHLHGLRALPVGPATGLMTPTALRRLGDPFAALLVELPQREIGGLLPSWDMLQELLDVAEAGGAALHLDGARLWECGPHYGRSYAEIVERFDSVYVSFYKGLRGVAGAVLAGPADFIAEATVWKRRLGGDLVSMYPYVLAARKGLRERLPRMAAYCAHAKKIAAALRGIEGIRVAPAEPVTPMMHLYLSGDREALGRRAREQSAQHGIWLFSPGHLQPSGVPGWWRWELAIMESGLTVSPLEAAQLLRRVVEP